MRIGAMQERVSQPIGLGARRAIVRSKAGNDQLAFLAGSRPSGRLTPADGGWQARWSSCFPRGRL
jgi:hypothetical protein